jgi:hypothetical protein
MPDVLENNQWDCPESAELSLWATEFQQRESIFSNGEKDVGMPLATLFRTVADIRHTAVHRIRVSARGTEQFMVAAESLATLLGDTARLSVLRELRRATRMVVEELECSKHVLTSRVGQTLKNLAAQRTELDRLEKAAVAEMVTEDGEYHILAGTNLEQAIASLEEVAPTSAASANDESSETEDVSSFTCLED